MTKRYGVGWHDPRGVFGAPIRREGEAVSYDQELIEVADCSEHEIEFEATDAVEVSHEST